MSDWEPLVIAGLIVTGGALLVWSCQSQIETASRNQACQFRCESVGFNDGEAISDGCHCREVGEWKPVEGKP